MKHLKKFSLTNIIISFCILFCFPYFVQASLYSVSPMVIDHELEKRDIIEETITLTNRQDSLISIYPTVNEVSVNEGAAVSAFVEPSMVENKGVSVTSWLEISRANIELKPGETKEVTLTIRVNPQVEAGEYHAFIGFGEGSNRPEAEQKVRDGIAPGTIVRIGVAKVQNQFLRLEKFSVERFIKKTSEGDITIKLANPGESPVIPEGEIIFYDTNGIELEAVTLNADKASIEPGKSIELKQEVPDVLQMGKYKAFLSVEYGETQKASLNDTSFFYVLPLKKLALIFTILLIFAIALALFVHRRYDKDDVYDEGVADVAMYIRSNRSESKDHDIDLSQKK
jgi:hypothetical protein